MKKTTIDNVKPQIVFLVGSSGYKVFMLMVSAKASESAIVRALKVYRPTISRPTVHKWVQVYNKLANDSQV
jgi:dihydrodipicolinate synthase/N-acetylneuraminate lyase